MPRKKKKQAGLTGEITRSFRKHKVYGTVYAVESDDTGTVLAAAVVTEATACRHTLVGIELSLDEVARLNKDDRDYEFFEPLCSDAKHLLDEMGEQERCCQEAESEWRMARSNAKECRETFEQEKAKLRTMVRAATTPLPLFDKAPAADAAPAADVAQDPNETIAHNSPSGAVDDGTYLDGVNVRRCSKCFKEYPCGIDHSADPPPAPPRAPEWPPTDQPGV